MANDEHKYATRLQEVLRTEGRTQAWLARKTSIDEAQISLWTNGIRRPSIANQQKIALVLERNVKELFSSPNSLVFDKHLEEAA